MPPRNFTDEEEAEIVKIYLAGHSTRAIARTYKLPGKDSILGALRRQGIKQRSPAERNRLYQVDAHAFDVIDNEEKAYWWGFIYADGCVHKGSLTVALKRSDRDQLVKLKSFLKSEHPITIIDNVSQDGKVHKAARYYATDQHLINQLRRLGIVARRGRIKEVLKYLPEHLEQHWIRGYFDGDGSARKPNPTRGPSIVFCGSKPLLEWIRKVSAENIGTNPNLSVSKHSKAKIHYLYFSGNKVAHEFAKWLYKDATVWMPRKRNVANNWPQVQYRLLLRNDKGQFI